MTIEVSEILKGDSVLIKMDIGNLPPDEVDKYMGNALSKLKQTFGCPISVLPVREGGWDFTIIRNPQREVEPKLKKTSRKKR